MLVISCCRLSFLFVLRAVTEKRSSARAAVRRVCAARGLRRQHNLLERVVLTAADQRERVISPSSMGVSPSLRTRGRSNS